MQVNNHILLDKSGDPVKYVASPNVSAGTISPTYIVIHYTAASTFSSGVDWHSRKESKVSAHIHLGRAAELVQMVPFNKKAWHAGASSWKGLRGLNSYSIGIELQNTGTQEYTEQQIQELIEICKALVKAYPIKEIVGHSDISPGRKADPGKQFPMDRVRSAVFGEAGSSTLHTTANLHLRRGPSTTYDSIEVLEKGTEVDVLNDNGSWSEVFVCSLKLKGWVSNKYIR